jgi:hypothetical protein
MQVTKIGLFAALLAIGCTSVVANIAAGTPLFTWIPPTQDINGSPIDPTGPGSLKEYRLYCDPADMTVAAVAVIPAPAVSYQAPAGLFAAGAHTCALQAKLVSLNGSAMSNAVTFTIAKPVVDPKPPTNLQVSDSMVFAWQH